MTRFFLLQILLQKDHHDMMVFLSIGKAINKQKRKKSLFEKQSFL
jgi:hypothetical protein